MKRLLIPLLALALCPPAQAKAIHLNCHETKLLKNTHEIEAMGETTYPEQSDELWSDIPVFINTDTNTATRWGKNYELTAAADTYTLSKTETDSREGYRDVTKDFTTQTITINRSTMEYKYKSFRQSITRGMIYMKSVSEKESIGQCEISKPKAKNKI